MKDRSSYRRGSMARGRRGRPVTGGARPSRPMPPRPKKPTSGGNTPRPGRPVTGGPRPSRPTPRPTRPGGRPSRPKTGGVMPHPKMGGISKSAVMPKSRPITTGGPTPRGPKLPTTAGPKLPTTGGLKPSGSTLAQQQKAQDAMSRRGRAMGGKEMYSAGGLAGAMKTAEPN